MMRIPSLTREDGFTVVEVMVAALILVVGVAGSVTLVDGANATTLNTRAREGATNLAREVVEDARSVPYTDIAPGTIESRLRAKAGLDADPGSSTWRIERRGFTYTVSAAVCTVDDAKDGAGEYDANSTYCSGSAAPGTSDQDPEDYKRVTVEVRWTRPAGGTKLVRQAGIVANPGGAIGVSIDLLTGPTDIASSGANATYSVTTNRDAATVEWWVDGIYMGEATGSGQDWGFTWTSDACEGVHHVTAQAFDSLGRSAGTRTITVKTHGASECASTSDTPPPEGGGGDNDPPTQPGTLTLTTQGSKKVQLNWGASTDPEGDPIQYRVYRDGAVIATVSGTDYTDDLSAEVPHSYYVTAVDSHGAESEQSNTVEYWPPGYTP
jgi:Tfp pilus assembly protein PilV